jgi:hypothetical protein
MDVLGSVSVVIAVVSVSVVIPAASVEVSLVPVVLLYHRRMVFEMAILKVNRMVHLKT